MTKVIKSFIRIIESRPWFRTLPVLSPVQQSNQDEVLGWSKQPMNSHRNQIFTVHYCAGPLPFHVNRKAANIRKRCESSTKCIVLFDAKAVKVQEAAHSG